MQRAHNLVMHARAHRANRVVVARRMDAIGTARERIDLLVDPGTFVELGIHAGPHFSQRAMDGKDAPADGVVLELPVAFRRTVVRTGPVGLPSS